MNIVAFILFGLINGLIINSLESPERKGSYLGAMLMGVLGALTGGTLAFIVFGGVPIVLFSPPLIIIFMLEAVLLFFLLFGKNLNRSS